MEVPSPTIPLFAHAQGPQGGFDLIEDVQKPVCSIQMCADRVLKCLGETEENALSPKIKMRNPDYTPYSRYHPTYWSEIIIHHFHHHSYYEVRMDDPSAQNTHHTNKEEENSEEKKKKEQVKKYQTILLVVSAGLMFVGCYALGGEVQKYSDTTNGLKQITSLKTRLNNGTVNQQRESGACIILTDAANRAEEVFKRVQEAAWWGIARRTAFVAFSTTGFVGAWFVVPTAVTVAVFGVLGTSLSMVYSVARNSGQDGENVKDMRDVRKRVGEILNPASWSVGLQDEMIFTVRPSL